MNRTRARKIRLTPLAAAAAGAIALGLATRAPAAPDARRETAYDGSKLTAMQRRVTLEDGTEPPFRNEYWNNKRPGIYVCLLSGDPLFSSKDKFDSGTGWPSFTRPLRAGAVAEKIDRSHGMVRTEVRSAKGDAHLGHVFEDGPEPTGLRYCINSAALRFIPAEDLEREGYKELAKDFADAAPQKSKEEKR